MIKDKLFSHKVKNFERKNITSILNDFFEEILKELKVSSNNYKKSNDEKYLTEIKNITGNSIEENLVKMSLKDEESFIKDMKNLFENKRNSRINVLGLDQNELLEKKFFTSN